MSHPLLSRAHLEALLIANAIVATWAVRAEIRRRIDRDRVSVTCWALLTQVTDGTFGNDVRTETKAQIALADRVEAITIADLCFFELDTLIALANNLPERVHATPAWERDLAVGLEGAA